jgi:NAD(P)-dependent dehydrogenase (short-subunit alcohol dehydrogenase family)
MRRFGRIDVLVNNAGIAHASAVHETSVASFDRHLAVHLRSTFLTTRLVLPQMYARDSGRIINTASQLAYKGAPGFAHYTAAKGAILSFTRSLALEIGTRGINVNCVAPGATRTPMTAGLTDEIMDAIRAGIPKGRIAEVDDVVRRTCSSPPTSRAISRASASARTAATSSCSGGRGALRPFTGTAVRLRTVRMATAARRRQSRRESLFAPVPWPVPTSSSSSRRRCRGSRVRGRTCRAAR